MLFELSQSLQEILPTLNGFDVRFYQLTIQQLTMMRNTLDGDNIFFETFFLNKTKDEVIEWIESEAKQWEW